MQTKAAIGPPATYPSQRTWAPWGRGRRALASVILTLHVLAVFIAPWAAPPPSSDLARKMAARIEPYLMATYLNHGYRYFAPNPGPSHLVRYELVMADGTLLPGIHRFPDPQNHWPRLLYHRYFMVSETVFNLADVPPPPPGGFANETERDDYAAMLDASRRRLALLLRSIAIHLRHHHDSRSVRLFVQEHLIPTPRQVLDGVPLDAPELYRERLLGELTSDGLWVWPENEYAAGEELLP